MNKANDMECPQPTKTLADFQAAGWDVRFSASGQRLQEMIEMYELMGLEVKTLARNQALCGGCNLCFESESEPTMLILTRRGTQARS